LTGSRSNLRDFVFVIYFKKKTNVTEAPRQMTGLEKCAFGGQQKQPKGLCFCYLFQKKKKQTEN
jgi:hypothetical protein